ncbi:hypothetical protein CBM2587_A160210 [Cupriavidus taiwanensis]|uniref:Uncharacterized protein n=1 Tax=Cupriavidus taiwanensis TaxID=164546 RepID=A0A375BIZ3_9BURK|nr:hypothetical protein CBM2587_A160210 [Cupriavidus taiwanensis]
MRASIFVYPNGAFPGRQLQCNGLQGI